MMDRTRRRDFIRRHLELGFTYVTEGDGLWTKRRPPQLSDASGRLVEIPREDETVAEVNKMLGLVR